MNLKIIDVFIDYLRDTKQLMIIDIDAFEERINELAVDMMDECYLLVKALKCGIYDMYLFNHFIDKKILVDFFVDKGEVKKDEAVFIIGVIEQAIASVSMQMNILNIDDIRQHALDNNILFQIKMIALAYYEGEGVEQDYEEAYKLFLYLLEHGDHDVLSYLGYMLENGLGVEEDIIGAIDYYEQGCVVQNEKCIYYLGLCYLYGKGYIQNERMALSCLKQCHFVDAYMTLASYYRGKDMNGEAFYYYSKAANSYDREALYKVGVCYLESIGTAKDIKEAKRYLSYASYFNQKDAFLRLGLMMIEGIAFDKNIEKGLEYIRKASELKCKDAYLVLGKFYEYGLYVDRDIGKATTYYSKFNEKEV